MLICHCRAVYESEVRAAIADGAADVFAVADRCEAGTVCGGCVPTVCQLLGQSAENYPEVIVLPYDGAADTHALAGIGVATR